MCRIGSGESVNERMASNLLTTRRFAPLFWCQFFSAFNDNFLKNALVFLILYKWAVPAPDSLITLAGAIFIFPYFILSAIGGELADRFDKALVARWLKLTELAVAALAVAGFVYDSPTLLFSALFLIGVIAALFGPIKYGILPDHLAESELPAGNALVEGATFMAILIGTMVAGIAAGGSGPGAFSGLMIVFALCCWISSLFIPSTGEGAPTLVIDFNIVRSTFALLRDLYADSRLWWGGLVVSWFWLVGAVVMSLLPPLVKSALGGANNVVLAYLGVFTIAVAIGSAFAAWLASGRIVLIPTVFGAVLLAIFTFDLGWGTMGLVSTQQDRGIFDALGAGPGLRMAIDLVGLAIGGGLFIVPSFAAVPAWAEAAHRARVVAAVNVLNAAFMTAAGIATAVLLAYGVTISALLIGLGLLNVVAAYCDPPDHADEPDARPALGHLPRLLPTRGQWAPPSPRGGTQRHHRAQPCELSRRRGRALVPRTRAPYSPSTAPSPSGGGSGLFWGSRAPYRSIRPKRWRRAR